MNQSLRQTPSAWLPRGNLQMPVWRVVVADDEVLPTELLKRMLARLGHQVVGTAQNGLEVLALARELQPDLVLMDLRMPVMDGWTAMAELARDWVAPVIVVSALDDRESLEQAVAAGASAFLTKPVREDDLERALELAVARFADWREIRKWRADVEELRRAQAAQAAELARLTQELEATRRHLAAAARRAALTGLARGLTHEINNALTPIIGYAQIIELQRSTDAEMLERTHKIIAHAQRIAGWTAAFRQIAVNRQHGQILFSLNGLAQDALNLYAERFGRLGIVVTANWDEQLPPLRGYPDQLQELLVCLLQNAVEAMRAGGKLKVQTEYAAATDRVWFTLSDTGTGIAAEHLARVTEPGFSTKNTLDGDSISGWGLFAVAQIVAAHAGGLEIASPAAHDASGTTVRIWLPLQSEART